MGVLKAPSTEKIIKTEVDYPYVCVFVGRNINFPVPKLNKKNVYGRLYNNAVILPKDDKILRKRPFLALNRKNNNISNKRKEPKFILKNALN